MNLLPIRISESETGVGSQGASTLLRFQPLFFLVSRRYPWILSRLCAVEACERSWIPIHFAPHGTKLSHRRWTQQISRMPSDVGSPKVVVLNTINPSTDNYIFTSWKVQPRSSSSARAVVVFAVPFTTSTNTIIARSS